MKRTTIKKVLILSLFLTITSCNNNQKSNFKYDYLIDKPSFNLKEEVKEDEFNKTYQEFEYSFDNIYLINFIQNESFDDLSSKTSLILGVENLENNYPYYRKENNDGSYYSLFYNPSSSAFIEDDNGKKNNLDNFTQDINISPYLDLYCFKNYLEDKINNIYNQRYFKNESYLGLYGLVLTNTSINLYEYSFNYDGFLLNYKNIFINIIDENTHLRNSIEYTFKYNENVEIIK